MADKVWLHAGRETVTPLLWMQFWLLNLFPFQDSFWSTTTGAKEGIVNQCWMCFTSLFLKLEISTLKKPWKEVKHKGVVGLGDGGACLTSCQQVSPRHSAPWRAGPCHAEPQPSASSREKECKGRRFMARINPVVVSPRSCLCTIKYELRWQRRQTGGLSGKMLTRVLPWHHPRLGKTIDYITEHVSDVLLERRYELQGLSMRRERRKLFTSLLIGKCAGYARLVWNNGQSNTLAF
jgi:hypothetical protein